MPAISARKRAANRRNAAQSTGPRTDEGKARSSANAVTHGIFAQNLVLPGEDADAFGAFRVAMLRRLNPRDVLELQVVERLISASWRTKRVHNAESRLYRELAEKIHKKIKQPEQRDFDDAEEELDSAERYRRHAKKFRAAAEKRCEEAQEELRRARMELDKPLPPVDPAALLTRMLHSDDPALERLHRYEQRLESSFNRGLRQLQDLQKQEIQTPTDFTKSLLPENARNEPTDSEVDCNDSNEEELATDGAPMNTDEKQERRTDLDEQITENAHGAAVGPPGAVFSTD